MAIPDLTWSCCKNGLNAQWYLFSFFIWLFFSLFSQHNTAKLFKIKPLTYFVFCLFLCFLFHIMAPLKNHKALGTLRWILPVTCGPSLSLEVLCASRSEQKELGPRSLPWGFICQVVRSDSKEQGCLMNPRSRKICQNTQNIHCRDHGNIAYLFGARLIIFKHMQSVVQWTCQG